MAVSFGNHAAQPDPSLHFLMVAREIAQVLGIDDDRAMRGEPLEYEGMAFSLRQHGALDPTGMVVAIETDPLVGGMEAVQCKSLLRQHTLMPPAYAGYYALSDDEDTILFCFRVDLEHDREPAAMVRGLLNKALAQRQQVARTFVHEPAAAAQASSQAA